MTRPDFLAAADRCNRALSARGLTPGDTVVAALPPGPDLAALLHACCVAGLRLLIVAPAHVAPLHRRDLSGAQLLVTAGTPVAHAAIASVQVDELVEATALDPAREPLAAPSRFELGAIEDGVPRWIGVEGLRRSLANILSRVPVPSGATWLTASAPFSLEGAFASLVLPLATGAHILSIDRGMVADASQRHRLLDRASHCELPGPVWLALSREDPAPSLPTTLAAAICGSEPLDAATAADVDARLRCRVDRGFGTAATGFWAVPTGTPARMGIGNGALASIRPLRSPLHLLDASGRTGEVVLSDVAGAEHRTGAVGWVDATGRLEIAGKLSDVVVRGDRAILLSDHDRALARLAAVRESRTFRERGGSPTERAVCVFVPPDGASSPTVGDAAPPPPWREIAPAGHPPTAPRSPSLTGPAIDRLIEVAAGEGAALPPLETLRAVTSGQAGRAVAAALTARRFRRNPAYDEPGLVAAVDRALLTDGTLDFLMFWGCGPRRHAGPPDEAAVAALAALLEAAETAAPLRARAHVICTDLHATNNGHAESHYRTYFADIAALARGLDVRFEMESAVWHRGGLGKAEVSALEREPGFLARWAAFPLRDRFVLQAGRHSRMADKVAAARHYYATCLLERVVLKSLFARSVFLTYNGPEFNECFPDLPTLYVYPGPRGPNDKPWFVADAVAPEVVQVAAA